MMITATWPPPAQHANSPTHPFTLCPMSLWAVLHFLADRSSTGFHAVDFLCSSGTTLRLECLLAVRQPEIEWWGLDVSWRRSAFRRGHLPSLLPTKSAMRSVSNGMIQRVSSCVLVRGFQMESPWAKLRRLERNLTWKGCVRSSELDLLLCFFFLPWKIFGLRTLYQYAIRRCRRAMDPL